MSKEQKVQPINGIKSVDFKIIASGEGVVNWNGPTALAGKDGKEINNHTMPKLRGYTNLTGNKTEKGYAFKKRPEDVDFKENPLYISPNCIRHRLFAEHTFDPLFVGGKDKEKQDQMLASDIGILRGYVLPASGAMRSSPVLITSWEDQLGNGNVEVMTRSGPRKEKNSENEKSDTSFFSKTTFGKTQYIGYGSINIEALAFISLDSKFGRAALVDVTDERAKSLAQAISLYIQSIAPDRTFSSEIATFHKNYVRQGALFQEGEAGILLSDEAIDTLVDHILNKIHNLSIQQGGGYVSVDEVTIDYNDSDKIMRIRQTPTYAPTSSGKFRPLAFYCSAMYLALEKLEQDQDVTPVLSPRGGISGISKRNFTRPDFLLAYANGQRRKTFNTPYIIENRIKDKGLVRKKLTTANGTVSVHLPVSNEKASELVNLIRCAGVGPFKLGKKGLAYIQDMRINQQSVYTPSGYIS